MINESEFWTHLEFRLSREFSEMADNRLRFRWCDGFTPVRYTLQGKSPNISGRAWICDGPKQEEWEFTLFLNYPANSISEIDWRSLLPAENVTRWVAVDLQRKFIQIEPSAAAADAI